MASARAAAAQLNPVALGTNAALMRVLVTLVLAVTLASPANAQRSREVPIDSACVPHTPPTPHWSRVSLPASTGSILLPADAVAEPLGSNPDGRHYVLEDSTVVDIWVTALAAAGLAGSGDMRPRTIEHCQTLIDGRSAMVSRVELTAPNRASVFLGMISVTLDDDRAVNVALTTGTATSRDVMLGLFARMSFPGRRH